MICQYEIIYFHDTLIKGHSSTCSDPNPGRCKSRPPAGVQRAAALCRGLGCPRIPPPSSRKLPTSRSAEGSSPLPEREGSSHNSLLPTAEGGKRELVNRPDPNQRYVMNTFQITKKLWKLAITAIDCYFYFAYLSY